MFISLSFNDFNFSLLLSSFALSLIFYCLFASLLFWSDLNHPLIQFNRFVVRFLIIYLRIFYLLVSIIHQEIEELLRNDLAPNHILDQLIVKILVFQKVLYFFSFLKLKTNMTNLFLLQPANEHLHQILNNVFLVFFFGSSLPFQTANHLPAE